MRIWPWQRYRFARKGTLWPERRNQNPLEWPETALVCTCAGVTRGDLGHALAEGYDSIESLSERTGATQACASCRPLVAQFVGAPIEPALPAPTGLLYSISAIAAILIAAIIAWPPLPAPTSVLRDNLLAALWQDSYWQQVSGYLLLGSVVLSMMISLRKRWKSFTWANFERWRLWHVALATFSLLLLIAHTGMSAGENFNFKLMAVFLAVVISGALAGPLIAWEERAGGTLLRTVRFWWVRIHIIIIWLFFALIPIHILSVYYF